MRNAFSRPVEDPPRKFPKRCLVIGVGNPFMRDDGVGIEVAKALRKLDLGPRVVILERQAVDLSILAFAREASKLVIVDVVKSGNRPGSLVRSGTSRKQAYPLRIPVSHEVGLHDITALARKSGVVLPPITVMGVEPADCSPGEGLSKPVADALPLLVKEVTGEVEEYATGRRSQATVKQKLVRPS